jgi:hypothetical protein
MRVQLYYPPHDYVVPPRRPEPPVSPGKIIMGILGVVSMFVTPIAAELLKDTLFAKKAEATIVMKMDECVDAATHWASAKEIGTREAYEEHIRQFPTCKFVGLAKQKLDEVDTQSRASREVERQRQAATAQREQEERARQAEADAAREFQQVQQELRRLQQDAENQRAAAEADAERLQQQWLGAQESVDGSGWIGVDVQSVTADFADALGIDEASGALVAAVRPGSPAASIGLQTWDLIWAVNDCNVGSAEDLSALILNMAPGTTVQLSILRNGSAFAATVVIGSFPKF